MSKKKAKNKISDFARKKMEAVQHRNDYIKRMKNICELIHPDLYATFSPTQIETIYQLRGAPIKIQAEGKVAKEVLAFANEFARIIQKNITIEINKNGESVSLGDYHYIVSPVEWMIREHAPYDPDIRPDPDMWSRLSWYKEFMSNREARFGEYLSKINSLQLSITYFMSDLRHTIYMSRYTDEPDKRKKHVVDGRIFQTMLIRPARAERKRIRLPNGEIRSAVRFLFVPQPGKDAPEEAIPINIPSTWLGRRSASGIKLLPVYITVHTLNRMEERIGCASQGILQFEIFSAFVAASRNKDALSPMGQGRYLVEYRLRGMKVGYLVISMPQSVILVHTFLMLTSNSTPEGALLRKHLGVNKLDKEYLGIDKLTTFIHSDIFEYDDTRHIFVQAGCGSLIELNKLLVNDILWSREGETIQLAVRMRDYLTKDDKHRSESEIELVEGAEPDKEEDYADIFTEDDLLVDEPDEEPDENLLEPDSPE
ncbi:MAG: hypothetical protein LBD21_04985 [Tannerellaceae bacterium]|jgi:hypothetical protein|nr:hypothetical protein [Tannerellaceae bacterium]